MDEAKNRSYFHVKAKDLSDWNPRMTLEEPPPKTELIPVGTYDNVDIDGCKVIDDSYTVYMEVEIWDN